MTSRAARYPSLLAAVLLACLPLRAWADEAQFHRGIDGVRLSKRVAGEAAWSPDGDWIAIPATGGLLLRNVETAAKRKLLTSPHGGRPAPAGRLAWSPDGKSIRYASSSLLPPITETPSWLTEVQVDGSGLRRQSLGVEAQSNSWASGGWPIAFGTGPYAFDFDKGPLGPKPSLFVVDGFGAEPRRIALIPHPKGEEDITEPVLSPDGKRVAFQRWGIHHNVNVWTVGADGSDPRPLVPGLVAVFTLEWAPDGDTLALGAHTTRRSGEHVYTVPATGGRLRKIVDEEILEGPAWSPDGRWLAYSNYEGEVWRIRPDGSGRQLIARFPGKEVEDLLWSPDGVHLSYSAGPPPRSD
jgi:Tol biopolymer transport system component